MKAFIDNVTGEFFACIPNENGTYEKFPVRRDECNYIIKNNLLGKQVEGAIRTVGGFDSGLYVFTIDGFKE